MEEEEKGGKGDRRHSKGALYIIGIGPGGLEHLSRRGERRLRDAEVVVGYRGYIDLILPLIEGKEVFSTGMTAEVERCERAIDIARTGKRVAVVSSGDAGIYGMAGLVLELLARNGDSSGLSIEITPGIPAFAAAASLLGAPLIHDFASVSLSDLLTPWEVIEKRVRAAAEGDFVIVFYNPRSSKRKEGLGKALDIVKGYRGPDTPVGVVRNATREGEEVHVTTIGDMGALYEGVDMSSILIVGNSTTFVSKGKVITPRGYLKR